MRVCINPHRFSGVVRVPASKSHTIRQLLIASLADGVSEINYPLDSLDTRSCANICAAFGATITEHYIYDPHGTHPCPNRITENGEKLVKWTIDGNAGFKKKGLVKAKKNCIVGLDVGNSGTTLYLALAVAGLQRLPVQFYGDKQIRQRSAAPLLDALDGLGIYVDSNNGCAPITIKGPWKGGKVSLPCPTSQYLSALLIAAPLAPSGVVTEIEVPFLNEIPYIEMTLSYLKAHGIPFESTPDFFLSDHIRSKWSGRFVIPGGLTACYTNGRINSPWKAGNSSVPADFSSAAFPAAAAAITGGPVTLLGLDPQDTQGDKFFFKMLESMGCEIQWNTVEKAVTISRCGGLYGGTFDLNATPDLLPAAAVVAAFAEGDTALVNVAHARLKETDRISVMAVELAKLGVKCTELPDGLIVHGKGTVSPSALSPMINGHGDHRIVMAFAVAALGCPNPVEITTAECAAVTYPGFLEMLVAL